jgi:hypothetical protein
MLDRLSAYYPALNKVAWQFFGTITFAQEMESELMRCAKFKAMLRRVARQCHAYFPRLVWCLRQEHGGKFGRVHFHFLLTGLRPRSVTEASCRLFESEWKKKGGGTADVRVFAPALGGVAYILKGAVNGPEMRDGRESATFGPKDCELMLSNGLKALLRIRR